MLFCRLFHFARPLHTKNYNKNLNFHYSSGYVDTDMTSHKGHLTPEQGALTQPSFTWFCCRRMSRRFVYLKKETDWVTGDLLWFSNIRSEIGIRRIFVRKFNQ